MCQKVLSAACVVLACLVFAPHVNAGRFVSSNCGNCNVSFNHAAVETVVVEREVPIAYPVPFTVAVPVVSYLWNGGGTGYAPVFQAQPAAALGPFQSAPLQVQAQAQAANMNLSDVQIDQLIARIEARLTARANNQTSPAPEKLTPPPPVPPAPGASQKHGNGNEIVSILSRPLGKTQKSCASCHTGSAAKGKTMIFTAPNVLNENVDWFKVWDNADKGNMPPEAGTNREAALSDQEVEILRQKVRDVRAAKH